MKRGQYYQHELPQRYPVDLIPQDLITNKHNHRAPKYPEMTVGEVNVIRRLVGAYRDGDEAYIARNHAVAAIRAILILTPNEVSAKYIKAICAARDAAINCLPEDD